MRCPTCNKPVRKGQEVCSYCGAMVTESAAAPSVIITPGEHGPAFGEFQSPAAEPAPAAKPRWPLGPAPPSEAPEAESQPAGPKAQRLPAPPPWTRWVPSLFFLLVFFALQYWLRNSPQPSQRSASQPTLTDGGFSEAISDGSPRVVKREFSIRQEGQVVFFAIWRGDRTGHTYSVRWVAPDGTQRRAGPLTIGSPGEPGTFLVSATLILDPSMPLGMWRAELFQDRTFIARYAFELRE